MGQSAKLMAFATPLTASAITINIDSPNWRIAPSYSTLITNWSKAVAC